MNNPNKPSLVDPGLELAIPNLNFAEVPLEKVRPDLQPKKAGSLLARKRQLLKETAKHADALRTRDLEKLALALLTIR